MAAMGPPVTTIVPFADRSKLPACAAKCGPLYDANGGCVPPAVPSGALSVYEACFCANPKVAPLSTASNAVCPDACANENGGQASIGNWFSSVCKISARANAGSPASTAAAQGSSASGSGSGGSSGDWISNHWQWVIMLVVLIVAIAGIWIGACVWRRRYLRRKDRQTSLDQKNSGSATHPTWGPNNLPNSESGTAIISNNTKTEAVLPSFKSDKSKQKKKRWTVASRT